MDDASGTLRSMRTEAEEDLRCHNGILFGVLDATENIVTFKCRSNRCGARRGTVVLHRFSTVSGALLGTSRFRDPGYRKEPTDGR